jgi:hypothetical protein
MGAKTWMLVNADDDPREILNSNPQLDRKATLKLAKSIFPLESLEEIETNSLLFTNPPDDELYVGCFPGLSIVAAIEFGIDYPSQLSERYIRSLPRKMLYLHAMHSVVDWFAYAVWVDGKLQRSLSLSPDSGLLEDLGEKLPFERPFWSGEHPAIDPEEEDEDDEYPFPFHPLELGEAALSALFGYIIEGPGEMGEYDPESIPLLIYKRRR